MEETTLSTRELTYDATMFIETFEREFTWLRGFLRNVYRHPSKPALIEPVSDKTWSYAELNADANRLANALKADGVGKNDIVGMQLYNCPEFLFGYIAPRKIGAISNPLNFNFSAGETAEVIDHNKPVVYIYDESLAPTVLAALELAEHKPKTLVALRSGSEAAALPAGHISYADYIDADAVDDPVNDFDEHMYDEVVRLQTSGTTNTPKGIPLNNANEVLSSHDVIMEYPLTVVDTTMNLTPWFHRGGLHSGGPTPTLYVGGTVVALRTFNPKACVEYIEKYGITFITGVPSVFFSLVRYLEKHEVELPTLNGIVTMGSPLDEDDCIHLQKVLGAQLFNGYGTTETFWNTMLYPRDLPGMAGSVGHSCIDDEVRVVKIFDERKGHPSETVPYDGQTMGEVIIKAPFKSTYTYVDNPEMSAEKFVDGWLYTGDVATWDESACIAIVDRKDGMIISKGENIYPARVEEILNRHPKVQECMVCGVPDRKRGEVVAAYVIAEDEDLTAEDLFTYCDSSERISTFQAPRYYRIVDELPYTATGKKQHYKLKERAAQDLKDGQLTGRQAQTIGERISSRIRSGIDRFRK